MPDQNTLKAAALSVANNDTVPAENVTLVLLMKRFFGTLQLGDSKTTNSEGVVLFPLGDNLRADTAGFITFIVKPSNSELYGDIETTTTLQTGIENTNPALNEQRTMWNVLQKTPLWLLFTYIFGVVGVWATLGYIVWQLVKIKRNSNTH